MNSDDRLINKTFFGIWAVSGVSILFGIACVTIDAVITGQFLGKDAVTASGLIQPVTLFVNLLGALFGPGLTIVCTRYMGMAKKELVNKTFSMIMELMVTIMIITSLVLFFLAPSIARGLSANSDNPVISVMVEDYLRGFSFAVVPMSLAASLSGLMMLDNDKARGISGMMITLVCDFLFDYLNVTVFHGGMWGMAIATALSNLAGMLVVLSHFTVKERVLRFSFIKPDMEQVKEVINCGVPSAISIGSIAVRGICFNTFLMAMYGEVEVAAIAAANSLFSVIFAIALGMQNTTSELASLLFGEEDRNGIVKTLKISVKAVFTVMVLIAAVILIFAEAIVRVFLDPSAIVELSRAAVFIRLMAVMFVFFAMSYSLCGVYLGISRTRLSNIFVFLREAGFQIICAIILGVVFGQKGFEYGLILSGVLMLAFSLILPSLIRGSFSVRAGDMTLLPEDFGAQPDDIFEASITSMDGMISASKDVYDFCIRKKTDKHTAHMTALFIEETVGNTILHQESGKKRVFTDIRVILKNEAKVIRIRDNGRSFDPVRWYEQNHPEDPATGLGIRIIIGLAKDVKYIPAMGLNNLMITL